MIATTVFPLKVMGFPLVRINIEESVSSIFSPRDFSGRLSQLGPGEVSISIVYGSHERLLLAVFCRSKPPSVLVKFDANDCSSRMQMGGQVHATTQLEPEFPIRPRQRRC